MAQTTSETREGQDTSTYMMDVDEREAEADDIGNSEQVIVEIAGTDALPKSITGKVKTKRGRNERIVAPEEVREHIRKLFRNESEMCGLIYGRHGALTSRSKGRRATPNADMFFMEVIPVAPTRFRPPAKMGETLFEHPANELLTKVLNTTYQLRDTTTQLRDALKERPSDIRSRLMARFFDDLIQLQVDVNSFLDSSKNPTPMRQGKLPPQGKKQVLEKKEGLFRKNMMVRNTIFNFHDTQVTIGEASELCRPIGHFPRCEHRAFGNRRASGFRPQADLSGASHST